MVTRLIESDRSIIPALDFPRDRLEDVLTALAGFEQIGAVKVGFELAFTGLRDVVQTIRTHLPTVKVIYDHQKAGTDIPSSGASFARSLSSAGIDAVILFPLAGPHTQTAFIISCQGQSLEVLVGFKMTHKCFLASEGGYIADEAVEEAFRQACKLNVGHFILPGNDPKWFGNIKRLLDRLCRKGNCEIYAPGFITQGGDLSKITALAGTRLHAFVGREIYRHKTIPAMRDATMNIIKALET